MFDSTAIRAMKKEIERVSLSLNSFPVNSGEYTLICQNLNRLTNSLTALREDEDK